ncbi:MAG TPA: hypothetical protein VED46_02865 [Alphaproteobacteria bacterium]|nr:hypothetical protein [Alphaproteobacteria bacterium]
MSVGRNTESRRGRPTWRRRIGVFACVLALLTAMFGHTDWPTAAGIGPEPVLIALDYNDVHADENGGLIISHHCIQYGQCSFQAVLAGVATVDRRGAASVKDLADQFGRDRTVSPWHRPPIV